MSDENGLGTAFTDAYLRLMDQIWHSSEEEARLVADPTAYARSKGLPVAEGAVVKLDRSQPEGLLRSDEVIADWTATPGVHILHAPAEEILASELSEDELEMVGAGNNYIIICLILV